jgi:hypothetical protein
MLEVEPTKAKVELARDLPTGKSPFWVMPSASAEKNCEFKRNSSHAKLHCDCKKCTVVGSTVTYRLLFVLVLLAHDRRRIVHLAVTAHPTAAWRAPELRDACP